MRVKLLASLVMFAGLLAVPTFGRDLASWDSLEVLKAGQRVAVVRLDGTRVEGSFAGCSDSAISIVARQTIAIPKESVARVYRRPRINRKLRIVIGAGIGVAVGAVLNGTIGQYFRNEAHDTSAAVWIGVPTALGAGIGAASGGGDRIVYRRP